MKDITAARDAGQGQFLAGADAGAEIGDRGPGGKATLLQVEQVNAPGVGIAVVFAAFQKAVGGSHVGTHQHGLALEDFVEAGDVHVGERLLQVIGAGPAHGVALGYCAPCPRT